MYMYIEYGTTLNRKENPYLSKCTTQRQFMDDNENPKADVDWI